MRKTKIVCTLGPACDDEATLTAMCRAGMNVAGSTSRTASTRIIYAVSS